MLLRDSRELDRKLFDGNAPHGPKDERCSFTGTQSGCFFLPEYYDNNLSGPAINLRE